MNYLSGGNVITMCSLTSCGVLE